MPARELTVLGCWVDLFSLVCVWISAPQPRQLAFNTPTPGDAANLALPSGAYKARSPSVGGERWKAERRLSYSRGNFFA